MPTNKQIIRGLMNYDEHFWRRVATVNVKLSNELRNEFKRHEEAVRRIIIKFSVERP
jgi:hypothetical protein